LIEQIGVYLEKTHQLTPLAARLYGLLMLCPRAGHSFEEIVELSKSSKSSVSTNLNLLLGNGVIEYFTKPGERKRYFRLSRNYLKLRLERSKDQLSEEIRLIRQIDNFNKEYNAAKFEKHKAFGEIYKQYLESHHQNLKDTIHKMNQIESQII